MNESGGPRWPSWRDLRLPAVCTLAVTLLRLAGELLQGPQWLFGTKAGGGAALVGIGWLIPLFGWQFGARLAANGVRPRRSANSMLVGIALMAAGMTTASLLPPTPVAMAIGALGAVLGGVGAFACWPQLGRWLLAYGCVARAPIAVITFAAIAGDFGTHYEKLAAGTAPMDPLPRAIVLVVAQALFWLPITLVGGVAAGRIAARRPPQR